MEGALIGWQQGWEFDLWLFERNARFCERKSEIAIRVAGIKKVKNCQKHSENYEFFERIAHFLRVKERITVRSRNSFVKSNKSDLLTVALSQIGTYYV